MHRANMKCAWLDTALPLYKRAFRNTEGTDQTQIAQKGFLVRK